MSSIRASRLCLLVAAGLLSEHVVRAQPASKDAAMAETLFEDAKKRMAGGDYAGACPKLAESYRLDPGSGTLTALAVCHEQIGKTASAWAEFVEVVTEAQRVGRADRERFARQRARALERGLSRLTISVSPETAQLSDLRVRRDDVVVGPAAWGVAAPVDPGDHVVQATAPGKQTWSTHVSIGSSGDQKTIQVPELGDLAAASSDSPSSTDSSASGDSTAAPVSGIAADTKEAPAEPPAPTGDVGSSQRIAGWVVGGAGIVSLGLGTYFGVDAISKSNDAKRRCSLSSCTDPGAIQENSTAKSDALFADITLGGGLVAVGVGVYLLLSAPSAPAPATPSSTDAQQPAQSRLQLMPWIGRSAAGFSAQAGW